MSRGFIGGILIGAVFSVGVAGVASFMVPMGPAPLQDTPVPSDAPDDERATNAPEMAEPPVVAADETPLTAAEDTNEDVSRGRTRSRSTGHARGCARCTFRGRAGCRGST